MQNRQHESGRLGEQIATQYLQQKGYQIIAKNYKTRWGEIDIVAQNQTFLVFVEVKLRKHSRYGAPVEFVTTAKQRRLILAAQQWLVDYPTQLQPRFDVIGVEMPQFAQTPTTIQHIENAFDT